MGCYYMVKNELNYFFGSVNNDREKEDFLREFGESLRNFIKTGVENKQLEKSAALKERFQGIYENRFQMEEIAVQVSEISVEKILKFVPEENFILENSVAASSDGTGRISCILKEASEKIRMELVDLFEDKLVALIKDMSYLSHANMLYELYEKETKIRREEKEFEEVSQKCGEMMEIVQKINKERRLMLDALERETNLENEKVKGILISHKKYFNMYEKQNGIQISLSPAGKKFYNYVKNKT